MEILKDYPGFTNIDNLLYPVNSGSITGSSSVRVSKTLDVTEAWLVSEIAIQSTGELNFKIEDTGRDGQVWFSDEGIKKSALTQATGAYRQKLEENLIVKPGSTIVVTFEDESGSTNEAQLLLIGRKLKKRS